MTAEHEEKVRLTDMGASCLFCRGRSFRRSRLQAKDFGTLLSLHYPVRCLHCSQRQTVSMAVARRAVPSSVRQIRSERKATSSWNGWKAEPEALQATGTTGPALMGGGTFPKLPMREPVAMPELRGIRLEHLTTLPSGSDQTKSAK